MGYHSKLRGEIQFHPPVSGPELAPHSRFIPTGSSWDEGKRLVWLKMDEEIVPTYDGIRTRVRAVGIRTSQGDELRADDLLSEVDEIWKVFRFCPDGTPRTFNGEIRVFGEESPDVWRVIMIANEPVEQHPKLVWPDGTEEDV
ncbi:hypothetical protein GCM10009733_008140 [Nonomuraea maheshkhaliensis]|uniref:Phage tail protein n=1 Tax=Nonomuraea maheshkhaliensis TaxID=419590 RepID=A0ABP4QND8_9ACTN